MTDTPIRFGLIGCPNVRKIARAINLSPNATLHAIAGESFHGLPNTVKAYGSYDQLLDDPDIDAVFIPTEHTQCAPLAAQKKKHVLMETRSALDAAELGRILEVCESYGVQFMDASSIWLHNPRTTKMKQMLLDSSSLGRIAYTCSTWTTSEPKRRIKPEMGTFGAIGIMVWNCLGVVLWSKDYKLPSSVTASPGLTRTSDGVILSCTASIHYDQPESSVAVIHCSLLSSTTMDLEITGSGGSLQVRDLVVPFEETSAAFNVTLGAKFTECHLGWTVKPEDVTVDCQRPQDALMVEEFARLVNDIVRRGCQPDCKWPEISRKTQVVLDALNESIDLGCRPVYLSHTSSN